MDALEQALEKARTKLANDDGTMSEQYLCDEIIDGVLKALGWSNGSDEPRFTREYKIPRHLGRGPEEVDYALFADRAASEKDKPSLLIEAKKPGKINLESDELQLHGYVSFKSVELAVLTDGDVWRFYLREGDLEIKDCLALEISLESSAEFLRKVLSCEAVANDDAKKRLKESRVRVRLGEASQRLLDNQKFTGYVIEQLREDVYKHTRDVPTNDAALAFLKEKFGAEPVPVPPVNGDKDEPGTGKRKGKPVSKPHVRGTLRLPDGDNRPCRSLREALEKLLTWAHDRDPQHFLGRLEAETKNVKRSATQPSTTHEFHLGRYWVRTRHNQDRSMRLMEQCAQAAGYEFGKDIEYLSDTANTP